MISKRSMLMITGGSYKESLNDFLSHINKACKGMSEEDLCGVMIEIKPKKNANKGSDFSGISVDVYVERETTEEEKRIGQIMREIIIKHIDNYPKLYGKGELEETYEEKKDREFAEQLRQIKIKEYELSELERLKKKYE